MVHHIPDGYHAVQAYLAIADCAKAIEFYKTVFGATEKMRMPGMGGKGVGHAELQFGDSTIMMADEAPMIGMFGPEKYGGSPVVIAIYVPDVDACIGRAVKAGAKLVKPVADQFYGDRSGGIVDPFGHMWNIATHIEDISPEEMGRRAQEMATKGMEAASKEKKK